jgi:hypothetical protein
LTSSPRIPSWLASPLEAEIEEAFAVATAVDDDAVTQPVLLAPTRVRVGTDLSWTLLDAEAYS